MRLAHGIFASRRVGGVRLGDMAGMYPLTRAWKSGRRQQSEQSAGKWELKMQINLMPMYVYCTSTSNTVHVD